MKKIFGTLVLLWLALTQADGWHARTSQNRSRSTLEARVLGNITVAENDVSEVIQAPTTVKAGKPFQVTITTTGSGCERVGDTGVLTTDDGAIIMVYDFTTATHPGVACAMIFKRMPHPVTLRFNKPGPAKIQVWGRQTGKNTSPAGMPAILEHTLEVR